MVRHFTRMSTWNYAVDLGLYPLGSCTMKYNPKINERLARLPGFAGAHPMQPVAPPRAPLQLMREPGALPWPRSAAWTAVTPPARRRRPGRAGRHHDDPRLPDRRARPAHQGPDARHAPTAPTRRARRSTASRAWPFPPAHDGVLHPEAVAERDGRGRGRTDDHQPQHPGPVRGAHPARSPRSSTPRAASSTATAPT